MINEISASKPSSPSILIIAATFEYTSPIKGVSDPKIIPSKRDTVTRGTSTSVSFVKNLVIPFNVKSKSILNLNNNS